MAYEWDILRRREDLRSASFAAEVAVEEDVAKLRELYSDLSEAKSEVEMAGRYWHLDGAAAATHAGLSRRAEACLDRLRELEPSPSL